jgi:hypothetical protein
VDPTLREALRKHRALRTQLDNMLLGDDGDEVEAELKKFVAKRPCWGPRPTGLSLKELITLGKYDWVNKNITEARFPMPEGFVLGAEPKTFHFNRSISSADSIKEMAKEGYHPATIWDLLDYGAKNPEEQRKYPIVALGSDTGVGGRRCVAYLYGDGARRDLDLDRFGDYWHDGYRFLAVRR